MCSGFFSTIHCNPSLTYVAVRDLQSSQRNASVQQLLLAGNFCKTNSSRELARERWRTSENSWEKNTIFNKHPVSKERDPTMIFGILHCCQEILKIGLLHCKIFKWSIKLKHIKKNGLYIKHSVHIHRFLKGNS